MIVQNIDLSWKESIIWRRGNERKGETEEGYRTREKFRWWEENIADEFITEELTKHLFRTPGE